MATIPPVHAALSTPRGAQHRAPTSLRRSTPWKSSATIAASTGLRGSVVSARWEAAAGAARMEAGGEHIGAFFGGEAAVLAAETASVGGRRGGSLWELGERSRGRPGTRVAGRALHRGEEHRGGRRTTAGSVKVPPNT